MLAPKRRNAPQWKMMMMIMMPATEHHFSVQCSVGLQRRRVARGGIGRSARVAVGRSVRRSERRSAFPCFSYFMIPKREWERIDYNDGHQATTIEQKKVWLPMYATLPNADAAAAASRTIRGRYSGVPNRLLCTFILFQDCFHPLSPTWNYCLVLKFPCIFGLFFCCTLTE